MIEVLDKLEKVENFTLASQRQRFVIFFIDFLIINCLMIFLMVIGDLFRSSNLEITIILSTIMLFYYTFSEYYWGKSIGKFFTKTKVLTDKGLKPDFSQCVQRSLSRLVLLEVFSFIAEHPVGWHDKWSKTRVVKDGNK